MKTTLASTIARLLPCAIASIGASGAYAQSYTGDPDLVRAISCERNTLVSDGRVFETVNLTPGIAKVWGHYAFGATTPIPTQAYWEIRHSVSNGFGGILIAAGTVAVTCTQAGYMQGSFPFTPDLGPKLMPSVRVFRVEAPFPIQLQGALQMTLCPIGNGSGRYYICSTSGTNGFGPNLMDGKSWLDSPFWGYGWIDSLNLYGFGVDFSLGVQ